MNKLEVIKSIEALKIDKEYKEALETGIQNIDKKNAIDISTEMAYEVLPVYEEEFPENKAPREALDLAVEYRKNPTELNRKKLKKAAYAAIAYAAIAAAEAASDTAASIAFAAGACADADAAISIASAGAAAVAINAVAINAVAAAAFTATSVAYAASAVKYAYDDADYEKFCCKYIDKMLEILKREEKE